MPSHILTRNCTRHERDHAPSARALQEAPAAPRAILKSTCQDTCVFGKGVPVHNHVGHINSRELGNELASVLGDRQAVLMKMHGAVIVGPSIERAFAYSLHLEENAEKQLLAEASGNTVIGMTPAEVERCIELSFGDRSIEKRWQYYAKKEASLKSP